MYRLIFSVVIVATFLACANLASAQESQSYVAGEHYTVLDAPVATRNSEKIEVVKAFSYGCPPCFGLEPTIAEWHREQSGDVDFWQFPAVWNESMELYARTFYASQQLNVLGKVHWPLFSAIVVEQKKLSNLSEVSAFMATLGVDEDAFINAYMSSSVRDEIDQSRSRVRRYHIAGAPEFVVNGKYRVDRMRAGGLEQMLDIVDYLVREERQQPAR
jgi:thiol:disulfide interchange protein DsbA